MATLEELVVKISADATPLKNELNKMTATTKQAAGKMESSFGAVSMALRYLAPAVVVSQIVSLGKAGVDAAGKFTDMAAQIDFAAGSLASLEVPLTQSGSSIEALSASIGIMTANIGQATSGNATLLDLFTRLGLSASELEKMGSEQAFYAIANALSKVGSSAEQAEIGRALLGRGFAKMKPLLAEAGGDLESFVNQQKELGSALDEQQIKRLDDFGDAIAGAAIDARNAVAGGFADFLRYIDEAAAKIEWFQVKSGRTPGGITGNIPAGGYSNITSAYASDQLRKNQIKREADMRAYFEKAKSGGFATEVADKSTDLAKQYGSIAEKSSVATTHVKGLNDALKDQKEKLDDSAKAAERLSEQIQDRLGDAFEAAIFDARNAGDAISGILNGVARQIARTTIINPLSEGIGDWIKSSGIGGSISSFLFPSRATGEFNVQNDMIAKVHKGEMIIPAPQAQAMRQGGGGQQIVVHQNLTFNDSVRGAARQEIMQAAPYIASQAHDAVFASIQRGGSAAKIVGKR
jgi:hypothetical protein